MDDWEKEYEEDRRRLALGQSITENTRHVKDENNNNNTKLNPFEENDKSYMSPTLSPAMFESTPQIKRNNEKEDADVAEIYAEYSDDLPLRKQAMNDNYKYNNDDDYNNYSNNNNNSNYYNDTYMGSQQTQECDNRFNLPFLPQGWNLYSLFGSKIGKRIFFAEVFKTTFKGFLSRNEAVVGCFITPNCIYIGDVETGALIVCVDIQQIFELFIFEGTSIGIRTLGALDIHLQTLHCTQRLVDILQKISTYWKFNMKVINSNGERAKKFKKEMRLIDKKSYTWQLVEDPRTGLRIVNITEQFVKSLSPISLKILHWFGNIQQYTKNWKGRGEMQQRCAWATATCFFISKIEGPSHDGKNIKHCIAFEYITELYIGPGGELGISATRGPPQPSIFVNFHSEEEKNLIIFIFQECYHYRSGGGSIKTTKVESVESKIRAERNSGDFRPLLFIMRPRKELYDFLRNPSGKK